LVLDRAKGSLTDARFGDIARFLRPGDCLVLNDTKVLQARFAARRRTGARIDGLFLRQAEEGLWQVLLRPASKVKIGEKIEILDQDGHVWSAAMVTARGSDGSILILVENLSDAYQALEQIGLPPLPPYIKRGTAPDLVQLDRCYYQTVYARTPGAVAAPTAGLHFTDELLQQLQDQGICITYVTLHVGPGSFKPVKSEHLEDHKVWPERLCIGPQAAEMINKARASGGRIVAVGTTSVRAIETAAIQLDQGLVVRPLEGQTDLYILPGYRFKVTDAMITNFHLPRSTLLALVAAFAGLEQIMHANRHAIAQRYMFYSYGDAMLIL
jgi:S-adenosylmethionine:tRNA ribosyltransferase-isomerase